MRADLNFWKKSVLRMRNPSKLLEKSKSLELNLREFWSQYPRMKKCSTKFNTGEDVVSFKKKLSVLELILFWD
jgi:hypothetical protein